MKLWLVQRFGRSSKTDSSTSGHALGKVMGIETLEHKMRGRVRLFLRHTWLVTILGTMILGGALWAAFYFMTKPSDMRIAAGPPDSANAKFVEILTKRFAKDRDTLALQFVPTTGPKESAQAMANNSADLAILPSTLGHSPDWPVIAILRQNVIALIVPAPGATQPEKPDKKAKPGKAAKNAKTAKAAKAAKADKADKTAKTDDADKLDKVTQLAGHRIGIVTGNEATTDLLDVILKHYGVPLGQVQVSLIDPKNLADAVRANQVDAIFVAGSPTGEAISNAVAAATQNGVAPTFIDIDQADGIAERNPAFNSIDIDAGTFGGAPPTPDDKLKSLSFAEYLVAHKSFDHNSIAILARLLYSSRLALAADMPGEIKIEAPSTDKDAPVVVHPGALAYLTDDQKSFFDKYGDDIFYGMLIFPVFGSAIAGVASYLRSNTRTRRLRLLQRLIDLVRKAHAAQSLEALDHLQVEVDNLVIAIIHQGEHEEYDQTVQMSFSFALDQVRFALAARRDALLDGHASGEGNPGSKAAAA